MTEVKIENGCWQKRLDKKYVLKNCTKMQNTEGQHNWREWLRGKGKSKNNFQVYTIWCIGWKRIIQKQVNVK